MEWLPNFVDLTGSTPNLTGSSPDLTGLVLSPSESPILLSGILNQCKNCLFLCNVKHNYTTKRHNNISFHWIIKSINIKHNIPQPWICLSSLQKVLAMVQYLQNRSQEKQTRWEHHEIWLCILVIKESNNI